MLVEWMSGLGAVENDTWPSTGALDTETTSLDLSVKQLGRDYFNSSALLPGEWENAWNTFVADFGQWHASGYFWNPTRRDELLEYRKRFNALLSQFKGAGIATGADTQVAAPTQQPLVNQLAGLLGQAGWVVAGVGAIWAASTIYKELRGRR